MVELQVKNWNPIGKLTREIILLF